MAHRVAAPCGSDGHHRSVGLGFRTPCLVVSPFGAGGNVCSEVFDHRSVLRLIETRFGVEVPNLSAWRRSVTGDLTTALALGQPADTTRPQLPVASLVEPQVDAEVIANALLGTFDDAGIAYPPPATNSMPVQETGPARPTPPQ
ncbi:MAG TPA: alkaline phosphatase family protein [Acidimicrobiales bacterium]|nr:alkaline phosphatase family protein [Acidimicrobiales bacterium]